jgi:hypothetical protein
MYYRPVKGDRRHFKVSEVINISKLDPDGRKSARSAAVRSA